MDLYVIAVLALSVGSFIHSRSSVPELRPSSEAANTIWSLLSKLAFLGWIAMLVWGFWTLVWSLPASALLGSLAVNALLAMRGPKPFWPGLSMLMSAIGLALSVWVVFFR
jgi:hypothetical protein